MQQINATFSAFGNIYGQKAAIQEKDIQIQKDRLKEQGKSEDEINAMTAGATAKLKNTRFRQAQFAAFEASINAYNSLVGTPFVGPVLAPIAAGVALNYGLKQAQQIKAAATGMDEVVDKPTMILAGEAGAEQVSITPLEGPNINGPQEGRNITVNVSGNVMSQDFVEGELAEQIKEAVRRGTDFGISQAALPSSHNQAVIFRMAVRD